MVALAGLISSCETDCQAIAIHLQSRRDRMIQLRQDITLHIAARRHDNRKPAKIGPLGGFPTLVSKASRLRLISIWGRLDAFADPTFQELLWIAHNASQERNGSTFYNARQRRDVPVSRLHST